MLKTFIQYSHAFAEREKIEKHGQNRKQRKTSIATAIPLEAFIPWTKVRNSELKVHAVRRMFSLVRSLMAEPRERAKMTFFEELRYMYASWSEVVLTLHSNLSR